MHKSSEEIELDFGNTKSVILTN